LAFKADELKEKIMRELEGAGVFNKNDDSNINVLSSEKRVSFNAP